MVECLKIFPRNFHRASLLLTPQHANGKIFIVKTNMKANPAKTGENPKISIYQDYMKKFEFMNKFLEDSEIFTPGTVTFRTFLIESFTHLNSDFHYLSFLNNEDLEQELVRVSEILQILPVNSIKKGDKLFGDMSEGDVHKFWMRFFNLLEAVKNKPHFESLSDLNWENKIEFLKNLNSTMQYLNYDFSLGNLNKLKNVDLDKEIEKWNETEIVDDKALTESTICNYEIEDLNEMTVEKLIIELKHIASVYGDLNQLDEIIEYEHKDFFTNFVNSTKTILKYKSDLNIIDSSFLGDSCPKIFSEDANDLPGNMNFIKRCNNVIKTLKLKLETLK